MMEDGPIAHFPVVSARHRTVVFVRDELVQILDLYGRMVTAGEWRDYSIDGGRDRAVFSVFRRASEVPLFRIVKQPQRSGRKGFFAVIAMDGRILKRGHDIRNVLKILERRLIKLVE